MTQAAYAALVALVAAQRLWEVRRSARHVRALRARGATVHARAQMPVMRALHGAWLAACVGEVLLLDRPFVPAVGVAAGAVFLAGQLLRAAAMRALGPRWTVEVVVLPGAPPVAGGIYRHVRHPNYLGVVLEVAALPAIHGAWVTAAVFTVANGALLAWRIHAEERALAWVGRGYREALADRPRLVPRLRRP